MARLGSVLLWLALLACSRKSKDAGVPGHARMVPRTTGPIAIDGEWNEPDWSNTSLRGQFIGSDGALSRPSSEVRFLRDEATLYVGLYAADDDLESATDAFQLSIGDVSLRLGVTGTATPEVSGLRVAADRDGTLDDPSNFDEEWLLEVALPLAAIGSGDRSAMTVMASRCDIPKKKHEELCNAWSGKIALP